MNARQGRRGERDREEHARGQLAQADLEDADVSHLPPLVQRVDGVGKRGEDNCQRAENVAGETVLRELRIHENDHAREPDHDPHVIDEAGPFGRHHPVDQDRGPQRSGGVEDAGETTRDSLLAPADGDPRNHRVGQGHDSEADQPTAPARPEQGLAQGEHDHREGDESRGRAEKEQRGGAHVLDRDFDREERPAPYQGEADQCRVWKQTTPGIRHVSPRRRWTGRA